MNAKRRTPRSQPVPLVEGLESALKKSAATSERPVCAWLKKHPLVVAHGLGGHPGKVFAEFRFGSRYRADFVMIRGFSGGWNVHVVELEPPGASLFTKAGVAAKQLNSALGQVRNWRSFIEDHRKAVLEDLSMFAKKQPDQGHEPVNDTGQKLHDPLACIRWQYHIIIGRRGLLSEESLFSKATFQRDCAIDVMTYDRLLASAKKLDDCEAEIRQAFLHGVSP